MEYTVAEPPLDQQYSSPQKLFCAEVISLIEFLLRLKLESLSDPKVHCATSVLLHCPQISMCFFVSLKKKLDFINNTKIEMSLDYFLGYSNCQITKKFCQTIQTDKY